MFLRSVFALPLLTLVACGGPPFTLEQADRLTPPDAAGDDAAQIDASGDAADPAVDAGPLPPDAEKVDGGPPLDGGNAVDAQRAPTAPTDCPPPQPHDFEVWSVYADGGFAPQPGGDCQLYLPPVGDSYTCASITSNWVCSNQSAGQPSILIWCRESDAGGSGGSPLIVVGCLQP